MESVNNSLAELSSKITTVASTIKRIKPKVYEKVSQEEDTVLWYVPLISNICYRVYSHNHNYVTDCHFGVIVEFFGMVGIRGIGEISNTL